MDLGQDKRVSPHYDQKDLTVVVPVHGNREIPKGTLESILKHAGLKK